MNTTKKSWTILLLAWIAELSTSFVIQPCARQKTTQKSKLHQPFLRTNAFEVQPFTCLYENKQVIEDGDSNKDLIGANEKSIAGIFNAIKNNLLDGEVGARGEIYFLFQLLLVFCIMFGTIPFFGDMFNVLFGPGLVLVGGSVAAAGVLQLGTNLTPWPNPPKDGSLVTNGVIFDQIRHPIYAGLLGLMLGLSIWSGSAMRVLLCVSLFYLLDFKSELEEQELIKKFGVDYIAYRDRVQGKFIPHGFSQFFQKFTNTVVGSDREK